MQPIIKKVGKYDLIKELGKGQFGQVFQAVDPNDPGTEYACKQVKRRDLEANKKIFELFKTEVKIMKSLNHINIQKCYDFLDSGEHYYLIINLCKDGDLENYIVTRPNKRIEEKEAIFFLQQIMNGFKELGKNKIMHRDLKPANVFLHENNVVIGDFGMAKIGAVVTNTHLGTPQTMAPEILFTEQSYKYTNKADLWSIGVTFHMMLFGNDGPFKAETMEQLKEGVKRYSGKNVIFPEDVKVCQATKDLIRGLLTIDPEERIEWKDFFNHEIFNTYRESEEEINKMLDKRKTLFLGMYKLFDENKEYVSNNPDFTFQGKTPHELMKVNAEKIDSDSKKEETKNSCCQVF